MRLLFLFVVLPAVELALLIEVGRLIGTPGTLALIVLTGMFGASLARRQGLAVIRDIQTESAAGRLPAEALVDGAMILVAGALLVTPGVLTDAVGFACLVPGARRIVKRVVWRAVEQAMRDGRVHVVGDFGQGPGGGPGTTVVDIEAEPVRSSSPKPSDKGAEGP